MSSEEFNVRVWIDDEDAGDRDEQWVASEPYQEEEQEESRQVVDTPLKAYLADMKHHPLITPKKELVLSKRIQKGRELISSLILKCDERLPELETLKVTAEAAANPEVKRQPNQSEREAMALMVQKVRDLSEKFPLNQGLGALRRKLVRIEMKVRQAMDELISANLRLVFIVAKPYINRGIPLTDLIQEGNIGLIKAAGKYDYDKGCRFSTYAVWWIRQAIIRAIQDKSRTIRLPIHFVQFGQELSTTHHHMRQDLGREPTPEELSSAVGASSDKVLSALNFFQEPISLESPLGGDLTWGDCLVHPEQVSAAEILGCRELNHSIQDALATLSVREQRVLRERFGMETGQGRTLEEVGQDLQISRERVRQIEKKALDRLRRPEIIRLLQEHI
ncbi:MAG: sigma-70 family RNA polymerase sigma factor [Pseudomonadota bacterium]